ncbi:uncharacterized protein EDB91DRAFT_1254766 [Suillus paluster]|uniref:uncharacterized protein n=1 Tax=Suillus paluster TaxID=48578 RepID=UPI001B87086B|nr:uncharacterized protein EDB91DRAFT_1254766 [Suillus paluster]KAG1725502.1 hypothetical protein EDB91DRAFT_1254766 [Suillus paluster]
MPPKAPRKSGGKKAGGTTVASGAASNLHLDERPIRAQDGNNLAKQMQKLDTQVAKCKAGVAWIDLLAIKNEAETNKLISSFRGSGVVSMKMKAAIPIIIDTKRIKTGLELAANFDDPDDVPQLELKDKDDIVVASGQHRLSALRRYVQQLEDEYASLEKKRGKISTLKHLTEDHIYRVKIEIGFKLVKKYLLAGWYIS